MLDSTQETLRGACVRLCDGRWRDNPTARSQAKIAVRDISDLSPPGILVASVTPTAVSNAISTWYANGIAPATINKRLSCLRAIGVPGVGQEKVPRALKWWLNPQAQAKLLAWLDAHPEKAMRCLMPAYVRWSTMTGLRVEESLRLTWADFHGSETIVSVTVPGLKTQGSQATLPVPAAAYAAIIGSGDRHAPPMSERVFPVSYDTLEELWSACRKFLGASDIPTATLKSLRRTAARYLHVDCGMPLDMVRQYLRHEDIETTMGYLRLTGGYSTEEMRRWVK